MTPGGPPGMATSFFSARSRAASGPLAGVAASAPVLASPLPLGVTASATPLASSAPKNTEANSRTLFLTPATLLFNGGRKKDEEPPPRATLRKQHISLVTGATSPKCTRYDTFSTNVIEHEL